MRAALVVVVAACSSHGGAPVIGAHVAPALVAALAAADQASTPWRCASADGPGLTDETLGAWHLGGHAMTFAGTGDVVIGVIADAGGSATALGRLRAKLGTVDLVLSLGGMGTTAHELEATLGALGGKAPVLAIEGDLEAVAAQDAAIATLRTRGLIVIDGRRARRIELPGATVMTIPGAGSAGRLVPGAEGCGYAAADVETAVAELASRPGLRIVASAEPVPLGAGIELGLHGPVEEPATQHRSGRRDGSTVLVTPGTSDATTRMAGPRRAPSAGLLAIHGDTWSWTPVTIE